MLRKSHAFAKLLGLALLSGLGVACATGTPQPEATGEELAEAPAPPQAPASAKAPAPTAPSPAPVPRAPSAAPAPTAPKPEPKVPEPRIVELTAPAGTRLDIEFLDPISSATSQPGDSFRARVVNDVVDSGEVVIPRGSVVHGTVTEAVPLKKKIGGRAKLAVEFTQLELPDGQTSRVEAAFAELGKSETKKDAATIGGAAAGGALLGRMLKRDDEAKGTLIGAIVGAAAGTAIAAKTEGEEVAISAGTVVTIELSAPVTISKRL